jgi:rare lipoprotein A
VGKPYQALGQWFTPAENYSYDETGIASWYGPGFHGKRTASGEVFDTSALTAAHPTLQMPSLARVTNLQNGRSVVVRINDRGPFARGRILDVSSRAADLLGIKGAGTGRVRVQVLARESRIAAEAAKRGYPPHMQMVMAFTPQGDRPDETARMAVMPQPVSAHAVAGTTDGAFKREQDLSVASASVPRAADTMLADDLPPPPQHVTNQDMASLNQQLTRQYTVQPTALYVQAGAFSNVANANALRQRLSAVGAASVYHTVVGGRPFYRVRLGPVQSTPEADALLNRTVKAGYLGAKIVVN